MRGGGGGLLLLLAGELALCSPQGCTLYKGIQGEDITLQPNFTGTLSEISWRKKDGKKLNIVAEWDGALRLFSSLKIRAEIDPGSGNLTIKNISQKIDSGTYTADVLVGESYQTTFVCLEIFEHPSAPNLTCYIDDNGIYVNCMTETHYDLSVTYYWKYINMNDISEGNSTQELSTVKLPKNTALSENINCTIVVSRTPVSNSISLMKCDSRGDPSRERGRIIIVILFVLPLVIGLTIFVFVFLRKRNDIPKRHPNEIVPLRKKDTENVTEQPYIREEVPHNDENLPSHEPMSEPENKKKSSSEEDPEVHTDESKTSHGLISETENKKTSSSEDLSEKLPDAELETMKTSSTEDAITPES